MNVSTKDLNKSQLEINISLTPEEMEKYLESSANRLGATMKVKGFREGKVPRNIVEKELGKDAVWEEALPEVIEESYWKVIKEQDIKAIGRPSVNILKSVPGNDLEFKVTVPVMPDLDLPNYKEIAQKVYKKERKEVEVDEKEVEDALNWLKKSREATSGEEEKPEEKIDDEFAKSIGGFNSLEDLKKSIKDGLKNEKEEQEKQRLRLRVLEEIEKSTDLQIADSLLEEELNKMEEELSQQVSGMGMTIDEYLKKANKDLKEVREGWRDKAKERVAIGILLRAIAEKEDVDVDEKEVEVEANKYLLQFKDRKEAERSIDPEQLKSYIRGIIKNEKVFDLLENQDKENSNNETKEDN